MSTHILTLTYSGAAAPIDPYWIRIEQESASESATITDAADLLDALFDLDPCVEAEEETDTSSLSVLTALPTTDLATAIEETLDLSYCDADADGSVEVDISIIRSHLAEPYTLRLSGGEVVETVQTDGSVSITLEVAETITLDWPVVSGFSCTPAPLSRTGTTLTFAADQVGRSLVATYQSRWDVVSVKVFGVDGEPGECTALAFHHGVVDELQLEVSSASDADTSLCPSINWRPPSEQNQVTCYKNIVVIKKCQCSDEELERYTYEQVAPCPDRDIKCPGVLTECMHLLGTEAVVERVECASDNQIGGGSLYTHRISDPDYYREMCCQAPPGPLPACPEKRTTYQGNLDIQHGRSYWQDIYGAKARFVPVPPPGGICGEWVIKQEVASNNCCDGVPALAWDVSVSPEVMSPSTSVVIGVTGGGKYPYRWSVLGSGFGFQYGATSLETTVSQVRLIASSAACGSVTVTVTDGCTTCIGEIRCTHGRWVLVGSFRPHDYYQQLGIVRLKVDNGYGYQTNIRSTMLSGRYLMSEQHDNPYPSSTALMGAETGTLVADADITGVVVVDPVIGRFPWKACVQCYLVYPEGTPNNWWRPFMTYPLGVNRAFYIFEWGC